jgi:hypothetical protein
VVADWSTIASLATAGGTLVLAVATFASVRSANRAARVAERSLQIGLQPVLVPTRAEDPPERVTFREGVVFQVAGGTAAVEERDGGYFVVVPLRNVGSGLAVLRAGHLSLAPEIAPDTPKPDLGAFRMLQRDLYVPPSDRGFWQIGIREPTDPLWPAVEGAVRDRIRMLASLLYSDHLGGHRIVSQFALFPLEDGTWFCSVVRHFGITEGSAAHPR